MESVVLYIGISINELSFSCEMLRFSFISLIFNDFRRFYCLMEGFPFKFAFSSSTGFLFLLSDILKERFLFFSFISKAFLLLLTFFFSISFISFVFFPIYIIIVHCK